MATLDKVIERLRRFRDEHHATAVRCDFARNPFWYVSEPTGELFSPKQDLVDAEFELIARQCLELLQLSKKGHATESWCEFLLNPSPETHSVNCGGPNEIPDIARCSAIILESCATRARPSRSAEVETAVSGKTQLSPRDRRNKLIYEMAKKNSPWKEIRQRVNELAEKKRWRKIGSIQGVRKAARSYAEDKMLPPLPPRKNKRIELVQ